MKPSDCKYCIYFMGDYTCCRFSSSHTCSLWLGENCTYYIPVEEDEENA